MAQVTPEMAIAHPNWTMGAKISVDSATMMNKGLELIEARVLFDVVPEMLDVVVHPQSIVHALVHFRMAAFWRIWRRRTCVCRWPIALGFRTHGSWRHRA